MKRVRFRVLIVVGLAALWAVQAPARAQSQQPPPVQMPQPGVPQIMTLEGKFVRAAYNNEGYVIIGYQIVNRSIGEEWVRLEVGMSLLGDAPDFKLTREALSLETPDGKTTPLASVEDYRSANLQAMESRAKVQRDSINYFPPMASQACRIGFFSQLNQRAMPWDEVELSTRRACLGQIYFHPPTKITYGQYWLNVKFEKSLVRVPFRVLTEDEEKRLGKNFGSIKKQVDNAFKPKKS
ncbi:MAG TPA: hypothetical protein VFI56_16300 [Vicinamibacterales bacterium]|nr:hypothetical protein [Vicinamibacterales bacterium]